jgi:hypothetical protein
LGFKGADFLLVLFSSNASIAINPRSRPVRNDA